MTRRRAHQRRGLGNPSAARGAASTTLGAYGIYAQGDQLHFYDAAYCFRFVSIASAAAYTPFTRTGAPDVTTVTAADWSGDTVVVFTRRAHGRRTLGGPSYRATWPARSVRDARRGSARSP